jgi:hypothetical protein
VAGSRRPMAPGYALSPLSGRFNLARQLASREAATASGPYFVRPALSALIVIAFLIAPPAFAQDEERVAVPDKEAQAQALERIKTIFPSEYAATTRDARSAFAQQLLELTEAEKDAAARFTLLKESVRLASDSGDVETAMAAVDEMARAFAISQATVQAFALANLSKSVQSREAAEAVADHCLALANVLIAENHFAEAQKTLNDGGVAARKIRGPNPKATLLKDALAQVESAAAAFQKVAKFAAKLEHDPSDPAANLELGKFECFEKGNWPKGLTLLTKGSDAALKKLAQDTLAEPEAASEQAAIAGRWWAVGEKFKGPQRQRVLGYASSWYETALPKLTGLDKVTAQKRVAEVQPDAGGVARLGSRKINLVELLDPKLDFQQPEKWRIVDGGLQCTQPHFVPKAIFPYEPPAEYDVAFAFSQSRFRNGVGLILPHPKGGSFSVHFAQDGGRSMSLHSIGDKYKRTVDSLFLPDTKYTIVFKVRKSGVQAIINGKPAMDVKTDYSDLAVSDWHRIQQTKQIGLFCDDPTNFYGVEVTEVTGEGVKLRDAKQPEEKPSSGPPREPRRLPRRPARPGVRGQGSGVRGHKPDAQAKGAEFFRGRVGVKSHELFAAAAPAPLSAGKS